MSHAEVFSTVARQHTPFILATALAVMVVFALLWPGARVTASLDSQCETWDLAASTALGELIADRSERAEAQLGDALFRLRRARNNCRHGFVTLARLDYDALMSNRYRIGQ